MLIPALFVPVNPTVVRRTVPSLWIFHTWLMVDAHDIRCDNLGSWTNTGVHSIYANVTFSSDETVEKVHIFRQGRPKVMRSTVYKLKKTYWKHKSAN